MKTDRLVDHQIKVEVTNNEGVIKLLFSDNQVINWPIHDRTLSSGVGYLILSLEPRLPTKEELAKQILKEILKGD